MQVLEQLEIADWEAALPASMTTSAVDALESGMILFAPHLPFELSAPERRFLSPACLDGKSKNVSFRPGSGALQGARCEGTEREEMLTMLRRYHQHSHALVKGLCPGYRDALTLGFTSFRPAEIAGRSTSWRKDDTRCTWTLSPRALCKGGAFYAFSLM